MPKRKLIETVSVRDCHPDGSSDEEANEETHRFNAPSARRKLNDAPSSDYATVILRELAESTYTQAFLRERAKPPAATAPAPAAAAADAAEEETSTARTKIILEGLRRVSQKKTQGARMAHALMKNLPRGWVNLCEVKDICSLFVPDWKQTGLKNYYGVVDNSRKPRHALCGVLKGFFLLQPEDSILSKRYKGRVRIHPFLGSIKAYGSAQWKMK